LRVAVFSNRSFNPHELATTPQLSEQDVRQLLDPHETVAAIERAFGVEYDSFLTPSRQQIPTRDGVSLLMPCYRQATGNLGIKFVAVAARASGSSSTVQASYVLFNTNSAEPQIFMAANWLTDLRTAATSFIASKFLARPDPGVLGVFGTGRQARAHIELFTRLSRFDAVLVCGSTIQNARNFVDDLCRELNINAEPVDASRCASQADVICTCTTARSPLFDGNLLRPGTHLNLVGTFQPESREVDSVTLRRARVVVDTFAGALTEAGDVLVAMNEGTIAREHLIAELHEIVTRAKSARQSPQEITVFKSVGCALEDLAVAELIAAKIRPQTQ
jgi:ornithine cyclodeaminase/alanine dehydrogenase-like protein (mu-crystallin family)